jgi:hypothetical protein
VKVKVKKGVVTIQRCVRDHACREGVLSTVAGTEGVVGMQESSGGLTAEEQPSVKEGICQQVLR